MIASSTTNSERESGSFSKPHCNRIHATTQTGRARAIIEDAAKMRLAPPARLLHSPKSTTSSRQLPYRGEQELSAAAGFAARRISPANPSIKGSSWRRAVLEASLHAGKAQPEDMITLPLFDVQVVDAAFFFGLSIVTLRGDGISGNAPIRGSEFSRGMGWAFCHNSFPRRRFSAFCSKGDSP